MLLPMGSIAPVPSACHPSQSETTWVEFRKSRAKRALFALRDPSGFFPNGITVRWMGPAAAAFLEALPDLLPVQVKRAPDGGYLILDR